MRLLILLGTFASYMVSQASCRVIENDIDNTIQPIDGGGSYVTRDWIKLVKVPPVKILQEAGEQLELECEVMGSPPPVIEWIPGRPQIHVANDIQSNLISESSSSSIVRVRSVLTLDHTVPNEMTYTCVGRSGGNTVYAPTTIYSAPSKIILPAPQFRKPKIVYGFKVVLDLHGSNVLIPCKAVGRPKSEIYWTDPSGSVINGQESKYKILPTGELLISALKWSDMGHYTCIARNSIGKDSLQTFVYPVLNDEEI